jgi:hypothetical protein
MNICPVWIKCNQPDINKRSTNKSVRVSGRWFDWTSDFKMAACTLHVVLPASKGKLAKNSLRYRSWIWRKRSLLLFWKHVSPSCRKDSGVDVLRILKGLGGGGIHNVLRKVCRVTYGIPDFFFFDVLWPGIVWRCLEQCDYTTVRTSRRFIPRSVF